jgi:acetyltransferase-like isoleucine patch superfamily enzyme
MMLLRIAIVLLPWRLRRLAMRWLLGYDLHPTSSIGWAWIFPRRLVMGPHARIDHLTVCKDVDSLELGAHAHIGRLNWISGFPPRHPLHFAHLPDRRPELVLGEHASITNRHLIDCTDRVSIGAFATVAGYRSQLLTHSIDIEDGRQSAAPLRIGGHCFVGTGSVILGGSILPDHSVLGANSLLNKAHAAPYCLYAGVPAARVKDLDHASRYFSRARGYVD